MLHCIWNNQCGLACSENVRTPQQSILNVHEYLWCLLTTFSKPSAASRSRDSLKPHRVWLMGVYWVLPEALVFNWSSQS